MNTYTLGSSYNGALGQYQIQNILNIDSNLNSVVSATKEIYFNTGNNQKTKIDSNGILRVYHPFTSTLPTVSSQWMSVEDALVYLLQEDIIWNADSLHNIAQFQALNGSIGVVANTANLALAAGTAQTYRYRFGTDLHPHQTPRQASGRATGESRIYGRLTAGKSIPKPPPGCTGRLS